MPVQEIPSIRVVLFNGKAPARAPGAGRPSSLRDPDAACVDICDSDTTPPPCVCDSGPCSSERCIDICGCESDDPPPLPCVCDSGPCSSERCIDICGCESDNTCPCEAVSVPPPCSCDSDAPSSASDIKPDGMAVHYRHRTTFKMAGSKAG